VSFHLLLWLSLPPLPQDLSPLSRDESDELWLQKRRRGRQLHRVPVEEVKKQLDFKNVDFLLNFVSDSGRIKPKWETGRGQ